MSSVVVLAAFLSRGSAIRLLRRSEFGARLFGTIGATVTASVALLVISMNDPTTLGLIVLLMLLLGSILSLCGFVLWHERTGFALRLAGWLLVVVALAVPSTLTLLLPLAALLAITLHSAAEGATVAARPAR
jgi:hypothetical protein